ncbi:hypothetical protein [Vibrio harveyi]|uniref:hypothetical protein n=1 Tax=Vibrio harveyi TaxID=669 RepID=UPI00390BD683
MTHHKSTYIVIGKTYPTNNYGDLEVLTYNGQWDITVRFLDTGTIAKTSTKDIKAGKTKDYYRPTIYDVGYLGIGEYRTNTKCYRTWMNMLGRCHSPTHKDFLRYGGKGYYVGDFFRCFQNFALWYYRVCLDNNVDPDNHNYELDKDIKCARLGITAKYYDVDTCCLVTRKRNLQQRTLDKQ